MKERMDDPKPEILRAYIEAQQCWWCGKGGWKSLPNHTCKAHGISAAELRELAYMYKNEPVSSRELRDEMRQRTLARKDDWRGSLKVGSQPVRVLSTKGKDVLRARVKVLREKYKGVRIEKTSRPHKCRICGKEIPRSSPRLCSEECRSKERHQAMPPEARAKLSATRKERLAAGLISTEREAPKAHPCPICGTWIPRSVPATCSPECAKALTRQKNGKPHPCPVCGTILPTSKPITCSPKCRKVIRQRTALVSAATRKRLSAENPEYRAELSATHSKEMYSKCIRCGKEIEPSEVHIFHGGKERVAQLEVKLGHKVSLCGKPVKLLEPPVLCQGCEHFIFDFEEQVSCPLCGWVREARTAFLSRMLGEGECHS